MCGGSSVSYWLEDVSRILQGSLLLLTLVFAGVCCCFLKKIKNILKFILILYCIILNWWMHVG